MLSCRSYLLSFIDSSSARGCPKLIPPPNGQVFVMRGGMLSFYRCHPGYELVGPAGVYCNGSHWNETTSSCQGTCCGHRKVYILCILHTFYHVARLAPKDRGKHSCRERSRTQNPLMHEKHLDKMFHFFLPSGLSTQSTMFVLQCDTTTHVYM